MKERCDSVIFLVIYHWENLPSVCLPDQTALMWQYLLTGIKYQQLTTQSSHPPRFLPHVFYTNPHICPSFPLPPSHPFLLLVFNFCELTLLKSFCMWLFITHCRPSCLSTLEIIDPLKLWLHLVCPIHDSAKIVTVCFVFFMPTTSPHLISFTNASGSSFVWKILIMRRQLSTLVLDDKLLCRTEWTQVFVNMINYS